MQCFASGGKTMQSSVFLTLPISCQICLEKVKEPVTCSNQHVFCSSCMNVWLDRNSRCPSCRVEITSNSPLRKIIGGAVESHEEANKSRSTARELRRARFDLVLREYEEEIFQLENKVDKLQKNSDTLKKQVETHQLYDSGGTSCSSDSLDKYSCPRCADIKDLDEMLDMSKRLQDATSTYTGMKKELTATKKKNEELLKNNDNLVRENKKIREEFIARSPMKYGRLTVATLESRLEAAQKELEQMKRAMEISDSYIATLEKDLKSCKGTVEKGDDVIKNELDSTYQSTAILFDEKQDELQSRGYGVGVLPVEHKPPFPPTNEGVCAVVCDETSKASSFFELQGLEDSFTNFTPPPLHSRTSPVPQAHLPSPHFTGDGEENLSFSRKLEFDQPDCGSSSSFQNTGYSFLPVEPQSHIEGDLEFQTLNQSDLAEFCSKSSPLIHNKDEKGPWLQPSPATKTVINAGGSRITMSQLSADDQDRFSRPSSAPSRTFLLSGSRFSALRPLDPSTPDAGFQPVKCISPMHMLASPTVEGGKRSSSPKLRLVAPNDVIDAKYLKNEGSKTEEELRGRDALSRVNILKRKNCAKTSSTHSTMTSSPLSESRRKQRLCQKRGVDVSFQSPQKTQRYQPK